MSAPAASTSPSKSKVLMSFRSIYARETKAILSVVLFDVGFQEL